MTGKEYLENRLEDQIKYYNKNSYRSTSESLRQEKYMYLAKASPFQNDQTLSNLSEKVETILAKENSTWNPLMNKEENKKK